jgi:hypothetical protein
MTPVAARVLAAVLTLALLLAATGAWVNWRHNDRLLVLETEQERQAQVIDATYAEAAEALEVVRRLLSLVEREMAS